MRSFLTGKITALQELSIWAAPRLENCQNSRPSREITLQPEIICYLSRTCGLVLFFCLFSGVSFEKQKLCGMDPLWDATCQSKAKISFFALQTPLLWKICSLPTFGSCVLPFPLCYLQHVVFPWILPTRLLSTQKYIGGSFSWLRC